MLFHVKAGNHCISPYSPHHRFNFGLPTFRRLDFIFFAACFNGEFSFQELKIPTTTIHILYETGGFLMPIISLILYYTYNLIFCFL